MKMPLQIIFLNIPQSDAVETEIRKRAEKLDQFDSNMMHCLVTLDIAGKHKHQGRHYEVRIDITTPGKQIAISRANRNEDIYVAIRDAFNAAIRKLQDAVRSRRGDVKTHEAPVHGRVTQLFENGHGFIETADGRELYFDRESVAFPDFDQMETGDEVQFLEEMAAEGLQAKRVSAGKHHLPYSADPFGGGD